MKSTFVSDLSGKTFPLEERVPASCTRESVMELLKRVNPSFDNTKFLARSELNKYREKYITDTLAKEIGNLDELDQRVLQAMKENSVVSDNPQSPATSETSRGDRIADKVASFGGSWKFIIIFGCVLVLWIALNGLWLSNRAFDPYPFILMNLVLSCLAAVQAPIIMMSQNRQSDKDRRQAENDYMVNLKSELEIRTLHEKLDHLMLYQQQELIEIQKIQIEMLTDLQNEITSPRKPVSGYNKRLSCDADTGAVNKGNDRSRKPETERTVNVKNQKSATDQRRQPAVGETKQSVNRKKSPPSNRKPSVTRESNQPGKPRKPPGE